MPPKLYVFKFFSTGQPSVGDLELLMHAMKWPLQDVFPILDLARISLLNEKFLDIVITNEEKAKQFINLVIKFLCDENSKTNQEKK